MFTYIFIYIYIYLYIYIYIYNISILSLGNQYFQLGLINYFGKFIPNLSELAAPLRELLVKSKPWQLGKSQNQSFERIKELLVSK